GLTILERNLASFRKTINEIADRVLTPEDLVSHIEIDMEIALSTLDYNIVDEVTNLQPFGAGNPHPLFCSRDLRLVRPVQIIKNEHVKLWVTDGVKNFEAIGFGLAKDGNITKSLERDSKFDLCYSVSINTWQGLNRIQLKIEDIRPFVSSQP
ncbi:MAG: hypothetical protein KJ952_05490, partial [Candidatus Omnitrophica bacterium]|nr:hypothetical protein [Candidatus Omnitrophota bacterium]